MRRLILLLCIVIIGCAQQEKNGNSPLSQNENISATIDTTQPETEEAFVPDDYQDRYILISDTSDNYQELLNIAQQISKQSGIPIAEYIGEYNEEKQMLAVPESAEDDLYAGVYIFRRYDESLLSIEYLCAYTQERYVIEERPDNCSMALVIGIYETKQKADSVASHLTDKNISSFIIESNLYMGCMH